MEPIALVRVRYLSDAYLASAHPGPIADEVRAAGVDRVGGIEIDEDAYDAIIRKHYNTITTPPGLGDYVANALDAIGITKGRVEALVGRPCGCPERQAALNEIGSKWLGLPPGSTAPPEIDPGT